MIGKLEECEINIPSFSYFCGSSNRLFSSIDELHNYERNVLDVYFLFLYLIVDYIGT